MTTGSATVVVDASVALKWVLNEDLTTEARQLLAQWTADGTRIVAPSWFACEVGNVLYRAVVRGDLTLTDAQAAVSAALAPMELLPEDPADTVYAMVIAQRAGQQALYDAQYAALASRLGSELWTADDRFAQAMKGVIPGVRSLSSAV
jgi:predicted nucleic acid-binding protein